MSQVTLNGYIEDDGGGGLCEVHFEYGSTTAYGAATAWRAGYTVGVVFSETIYDLGEGVGIHFRAVARNAAGIFYGNDMSFTTLSPEKPVNVGDELILIW